MGLLSRLTGRLPASLHILRIPGPLSAVPLALWNINAPDTPAAPQYWGMPGMAWGMARGAWNRLAVLRVDAPFGRRTWRRN
jgi:hypothetical protein